MNITFAELGNFLGIKKEQAETFVAKMIAEQRINARDIEGASRSVKV